MFRQVKVLIMLLLAALLLGGCGMLTVDQMYCLPKRTEDHRNLQTAIEQAMSDLSYCAPLSGEHQQPVQMADLDGDEVMEYLLFAKSTQGHPLRILLFRNINGRYVHTNTIQNNGSAFDQVEFVDLDNKPGVEIVVGSQVSNEVLRSVSVYTFSGDEMTQLVTTNYSKYLTVDLNKNGVWELMVIRPGSTDRDNGIVELYSAENGKVERSNEAMMSQPADMLKRIIVGKLYGGGQAVYIASAVGANGLITDIYTVREGLLINVTRTSHSGTSIQTMRNYYVYAEYIDNDGVIELPALLAMKPVSGQGNDGNKQQLIRWYSMTPTGEEVDKIYTFHNFADGWYLQINSDSVARLTVISTGNRYDFLMWDETYKTTLALFSVYSFTGPEKDELAAADGKFLLLRSENAVYAASLWPGAEEYGITRESIMQSFRMIRQDWKTGET